MSGDLRIAKERKRQIAEEGYTPSHDDGYVRLELAKAAACYVLHDTGCLYYASSAPGLWPWNPQWWKPSERIRDLTKAGALIAAEIDRLERLAAKDA